MTPLQLDIETDEIMDLLDERDLSAEEVLWLTSMLTSKAIAQLPVSRPARKKILKSFMESTKRNISVANEEENRQFQGRGRYTRRWEV